METDLKPEAGFGAEFVESWGTNCPGSILNFVEQRSVICLTVLSKVTYNLDTAKQFRVKDLAQGTFWDLHQDSRSEPSEKYLKSLTTTKLLFPFGTNIAEDSFGIVLRPL